MSFFNTSYTVILPYSHGNFAAEWQSCLDRLTDLSKNDHLRIFKLNIFISSTDSIEFRTRKKFISDFIIKSFGNNCPTFGVLAISPEDHYHATIEVGLVKLSGGYLYYRKHNDLPYSLLVRDNYKELWVNGIETSSTTAETEEAAGTAFDIMHQILSAENLTFDNIVRQWNYIGEILNTVDKNTGPIRNYQIFNKVRFEYYNKFRQTPGYPAATGVGMNYKSVMIDFFAAEPSEGLHIFSIGNPQQKDPYDYDQVVLSDSLESGKEDNHPPLFERAKLIADQNSWRLFVSGTASITGQETAAVGNLQEQTRITIENIKRLTSFENIQSHYPQILLKDTLKFNHIRVYVKNLSDVAAVKSVCRDYFGNIPAVYIQSHICRANLLVEIEAELSKLE